MSFPPVAWQQAWKEAWSANTVGCCSVMAAPSRTQPNIHLRILKALVGLLYHWLTCFSPSCDTHGETRTAVEQKAWWSTGYVYLMHIVRNKLAFNVSQLLLCSRPHMNYSRMSPLCDQVASTPSLSVPLQAAGGRRSCFEKLQRCISAWYLSRRLTSVQTWSL